MVDGAEFAALVQYTHSLDLVKAQSPDGAHATGRGAVRDRPCAVDDVDAVEEETLSGLVGQVAVAAPIVEVLDDADDHAQPASEPWRSTDTISTAVRADSRPLLVSSGSERTSA
jgi:hypothetical protein